MLPASWPLILSVLRARLLNPSEYFDMNCNGCHLKNDDNNHDDYDDNGNNDDDNDGNDGDNDDDSDGDNDDDDDDIVRGL